MRQQLKLGYENTNDSSPLTLLGTNDCNRLGPSNLMREVIKIIAHASNQALYKSSYRVVVVFGRDIKDTRHRKFRCLIS